MTLWFVIAFAILALGYGYVGWRLIAPAALPVPWNTIAWFALIIVAVLPICLFLIQAKRFEPSMHGVLSWAGYLSLGLFSFLLILTLARDLLWIFILAGTKLVFYAREMMHPETNPTTFLDSSRRRFLIETTNLGILGVGGILT